MTLGNNPQPLTRRQLRELAREQQSTTDAEAGKAAAPAKRMVRPTAPKGDRQPAASFTELIEQVEAPKGSTPSGFAPRSPEAVASAFKRPSAGDRTDTPERTLTRRELREMMAAKTAETAEATPDAAKPGAADAGAAKPDAVKPQSITREPAKTGPAKPESAAIAPGAEAPIPALDPVQQVLRPAPRPLLGDVHDEPETPGAAEPFDQLISRGSSVSVTTSNTLILPSIPQQPTGSAMSMTGEVLITGSIDLPRGFGSTGAPADRFDTAEVDRMLDQADESTQTSNVAPVSASRAVSTHTSTRGVMTPPKKHMVSLPMVLAITAGVLLVGVVTLFAAGYLFQIF
jgi:hypothetical protein